MIDQHLGRRRSVSDFQRGVLALRKKDTWPRACNQRLKIRPRLCQSQFPELQQVARQVRKSKAVARTEPESPEGVIAQLRQTITELRAENAVLKAKLAERTS